MKKYFYDKCYCEDRGDDQGGQVFALPAAGLSSVPRTDAKAECGDLGLQLYY